MKGPLNCSQADIYGARVYWRRRFKVSLVCGSSWSQRKLGKPNVTAMEIRQYKLEIAVPIVNDGATILGAGLIVKDLGINSVAFGFEARHYAVAGSNAMPAVL